MQQDSINFSSSGHMTDNENISQESKTKSFQCSHCTLYFNSKVYLFEHINKVHGFDVDAALREAGLKYSETNKANTDNNSTSSGDGFECQHCDFKASNRELFNNHEKLCYIKSEDQNVLGNLIISENLGAKITVISTNQHSEAAGENETATCSSVTSTSKSKSTLNSPKDIKTYKRPLKTINKYFVASSGSNGNPPVKLADSAKLPDSTKGTILLQESPSSSSPNSSGVFKVNAKSMIDITHVSHQFLLNDQLFNTDLRPPKLKEQARETVPDKGGKRTNNERSRSPPAKKAKSYKEQTKLPDEANTSKQQSSRNTEFAFDVSEDEGEKKLHLVNGDTESSKVYFCKHCDYSDVGITHVSTHYQNHHPYIRYNVAYIQNPKDESATFRCLHCPAEFLSVAKLKKHYTENHPGAPNVFKMHSHELSLVFKCFVCPLTTNVLKALIKHYKENHPTHRLDNSLMYCRYSATGCQEESSQSNVCEKATNPERPGRISPESSSTPSKEVKNAPSPQHPTSTIADMLLYHCNTCKFSHKSVVVMHVHYQKIHPGEEVTIDKIKQSARVTSTPTSQMTQNKSPNPVTITEKSAPQTSISDSYEQTKDKAKPSQPKHPTEASKTNSESPRTQKQESDEDGSKSKRSPTKHYREMDSLSCSSPNKLFYCQFCSYSSTNIKSVVGHHNAKHTVQALTCIEEILSYSAEVQKKKLQSEDETSASTKSSNTKRSKPVEVYREQVQHVEDDAAVNAYACAENLFYCQKCNYGNPSLKGVANHQCKVHRSLNYSRECTLQHTTLIRDEIEKSKSKAKEFSFSTRLPLPIMNKGDEDMFFCHFCNYRHQTMKYVLRHYLKKHHGCVITSEQVRLYTGMVCEKAPKSHPKTNANQEVKVSASLGGKGNETKKTNKHGKSASQTQRTLHCHRCPYTTQYVCVLKRHIWKIHRTNRTISNVLRVCFKQGNLQAGYHCDTCVFSHEDAAEVHKHYQEQHPGRKPSLEYVTNRLYVGPTACPPKRKKPQRKQTDVFCDGDGNLTSQRSGQSETSTYSCRACSFKGSSLSVIARHYRDVHPWSVKEDGSVLDVVKSKRPSANRQVQDNNNKPESFESYQVPLEFDVSPVSSPNATASSKMLTCPYCPTQFYTQHGINIHCGMKHYETVNENSEEQQEQIQTGMHVFKCPHCTYVSTSYQGVLNHIQWKHTALTSRADSFHIDKAHLTKWDDCLKKKGPGNPGNLKISGYMCRTCPHICSTLEKLKRHCKNEHMETKTPKPSAVGKIKQHKTLSNQLPVSQVSFLSKKIYAVVRCQYCAYSCSTKIALDRHVRVHHKVASVSTVQDSTYKCALCFNSYSTKKRLGSHYINKHGKGSFLEYYAPVYKTAHEKSAPTSNDPLTQQPENTREPCKSSTMTEENKKLIYRCPTCPYVNASYHGTLTHCQMRHPDIIARADELQTDVVPVTNMVGCMIGSDSNVRGYMCKMCPLIYASLKKLKIHYVRDHDGAEPTASEHSAEKQPDHGSQDSALKSLKSNPPAVSATEMGFQCQLSTLETCRPNTLAVQNKQIVYKCHMCSYKGYFRRYLQCHYKNTHKLDPLTTQKLLESYDKYKRNNASKVPIAEFEECAPIECKKCQGLMFHSPQLLLAHYGTFHSSDCIDFTVLSQGTKKGSTGLYRCVHCNKQINGIRKLWYHLDCHREMDKRSAKAVKTTASPVTTTTPEAKSLKLDGQDELLVLETVEELSRWNVTPVQTFTLPQSPLSPSPNLADVEQPQLKSGEHPCQQCRRTFMSLKGLRSHERSHAALAAIKKLDNLPTSVLKHDLNKYVLYKAGTMKPFLCSFCSYRTTVMGLWRSHFMKSHRDVMLDSDETEKQDEEGTRKADKEPLSSSEEFNYWPEIDEEPEITEMSMYLEPPDVQRQLNHYSSMAQTDALSKTNKQEATLPDNCLLDCEFCNFNSGHLSSIRRHYLNRHGKKIFRCKDCEFFTGLRKTLEMHMEKGHSTCQSEPTHHKDLRCPFCLYQTKNKNNMIDHIVLHREERVVPIEVRRSKLSHCLQGIVFRCHKCTFTSGSAENLNLHMTRHNDIKPYRCQLCYFDCTQLSDLEAHLSDKHQVLRNHELVGQVSLDQLQERVDRMPEEEEEPSSNLEHHNNNREDVETDEFVTDCNEVEEADQKQEPRGKNEEISGKIAEKAQAHKLHNKAFQHKTLDIEARVEENTKRHICTKADQNRTIKTEDNIETEDVGNVRSEMVLLGEKGSIPLAHKTKKLLNAEAISALSLRAPMCAQLKISHKESLAVSLTNGKNEQVHKHIVEVRDPYQDMPVLEKEYLKEEMQTLGYKDRSDHLKQKRDQENEMITDDEKKHEEVDGRNANSYVPKGALPVTEGAAEFLCLATTEEKPFTCKFCGRNLMNSSELQRHIVRHRI